jgi:AcrR family transcriptional regulator
VTARVGKGEQTRSAILDEALALASRVGLQGLSIGALASALGMSKSGLFAHFGSKEELQLGTLERAQGRFAQAVFQPAVTQPAGLPRLRALFENWLGWLESGKGVPGGCTMLAAAIEYDDRPGPVREAVLAGQRELRGALAKAVRGAMDSGHLRAGTDPWQIVFEAFGIVLAAHHEQRLLGDARAGARARTAFERLLAHYSTGRDAIDRTN